MLVVRCVLFVAICRLSLSVVVCVCFVLACCLFVDRSFVLSSF